MRGLAGSISDVKDVRAMPSLIRLLHSNDVYIRRGAVTALRNIGNTEAIIPFSQALADSDQEVRYKAVMGLAVITGEKEWATTIERFKEDEQPYITHWRERVKSIRQ